jgi:outer membrane protein assembly factor BamB
VLAVLGLSLLLALLLSPPAPPSALEAVPASPTPAASPLPAELAGVWAGEVTHDGETTPFALELEPGADGKVLVKATVPAAHLVRTPLGRVSPEVNGRELKLGPFAFTYDPGAKTLAGVVPEELAPVYRLPLLLRRAVQVEPPARAEPGGTLASPVWTFDAGAPLWPGPTVAHGVVFVGGQDGQLHAIDARSGQKRWSFRAGGPVRTRPGIVGDALVFQADDGYLYKLDAATGVEAWRVPLVSKPIERLPFDNPKSRYDRFGSDVTVGGGRLYVGTHDGHVVALDRRRASGSGTSRPATACSRRLPSTRVASTPAATTRASTRSMRPPAPCFGSARPRAPSSRRRRWRAISSSSATAPTTSSACGRRRAR